MDGGKVPRPFRSAEACDNALIEEVEHGVSELSGSPAYRELPPCLLHSLAAGHPE